MAEEQEQHGARPFPMEEKKGREKSIKSELVAREAMHVCVGAYMAEGCALLCASCIILRGLTF